MDTKGFIVKDGTSGKRLAGPYATYSEAKQAVGVFLPELNGRLVTIVDLENDFNHMRCL